MLYAIQRMLPRAPVSTAPDSRGALYGQVAKLHARVDCSSVHTQQCSQCKANRICSGLYRDYLHRFGTGEPEPIAAAAPITDPLHYIRRQRKLVEREDEVWALEPTPSAAADARAPHAGARPGPAAPA